MNDAMMVKILSITKLALLYLHCSKVRFNKTFMDDLCDFKTF